MSQSMSPRTLTVGRDFHRNRPFCAELTISARRLETQASHSPGELSVKKLLASCLLALLPFALIAQTPNKNSAAPKITYIIAGRLFDATSDSVRQNVGITIEGDRRFIGHKTKPVPLSAPGAERETAGAACAPAGEVIGCAVNAPTPSR